MSTISATTNSNSVYAAGSLTGATGLSPEALLAYCQTQLNGLDGEIKNSINQQNLELQEREAAETAQGVLEQYGDNGPTGPTGPEDMQKCVDALNQAISSLPAGDPVAAQLQKFESDMTSKYGFTPATPMTPAAPVTGAAVPATAAPASGYGSIDPLRVRTPAPAPSADANSTGATGPTEFAAQMSSPPQNDDWKGTCQTLDNIVGDIKSNAEIQMLSLQDLVSQRQQAVSLACSMMSKEDTSLEQLSHLGQQ